MKTTRACDWQELAGRNNDGLAISLLWNKAEDRVKLSITDSRCDETFELGLAGEDALTAFNHPFAFAALRGVHFGDALSESIDLQLQS